MTAQQTLSRAVREGRETLRRAITAGRARVNPGRPAAPRSVAAPAPAPVPLAVGPSELLRRRDAIARRLAELQWDLGGLAYEMAIRDHFRLDVLLRSAAELQEVDCELAEVERLLKLDEAGAAGACPACSALHARGASFCWQCGAPLLPAPAPASPVDAA